MSVNPRILVVEDDDALGTLLRYNLEREGYAVAVATDGEEALIQADEQLPDLVVLDWMLPKVSGIEVCRRLRAQPWGEHLTVIACTGWGQDEDRQRARAAGFDAHHPHARVLKERMEETHRVAAPADTGDEEIRQPFLAFQDLAARFHADDAVEITDHHRKGVGTQRGTEDVMRGAHVGHPVAQRLVHGLL